jgi:hypothetical protein
VLVCAWAAPLSTPVTAVSSKETAKALQDAERLIVACIETPCSRDVEAFSGLAFVSLAAKAHAGWPRKRLHMLYQLETVD